MAKIIRGNFDWTQLKGSSRQGDANVGQSFGGGSTTSGHVAIYDGFGNVVDSGSAAFSMPLTTKGDLLGYSTVPARVPVGTDGQILIPDSSSGLGLKWVDFISTIGSVLFATGTNYIQVPYACTIVGWSILADVSGSASVDVCFHSGSAPPSAPSVPNTSSDKISASAPIAISSAQTASGGSTAISTWTKTITQWGSVLFNLTSLTTATRVLVELYVRRT